MRENPVFRGESQSQIILRDFDAPVNVGAKYVQRLTSYLQVKRILHIQMNKNTVKIKPRVSYAYLSH